MRIYIAGPYAKGDPVVNIRRMIMTAERIIEAGHVPFVPLLYHLWHLMSPHDYSYWMSLDRAWIEACDMLIWLDGESSGTQEDIAIAEHLGIAVYSEKEFFDRLQKIDQTVSNVLDN